MSNSINTNISAYYAQRNINTASNQATNSIARLSSGNRIVRSGDDVSALAIGTGLRTNVTTLRQALINTSQGTSLLQVADGALSQISEILQRQKAVATQAGSGSLTATERGFLNQEFQNLTQEIDRLASQTNFNGVGLLNGSLTKTVSAVDVDTAAAQSIGSLSFTTNAADGETIILNGQTITLDLTPTATQVQIGTTISETLENLATFLNSSTNTALSVATYRANGNTFEITAKAGGIGAQDYIISGAGTYTDNANAAAINAPNVGSFLNVFAVEVGVASVTDVAVAAAATATIPLQGGTTLTAAIGGAAANTLITYANGQSLEDIVNTINAGTGTHGVTAQITGFSGRYNIVLNHTNPDLDNNAAATDGGDLTLAGTGYAAGLDYLGAATAAPAANTTTHIRVSGLGSGGATGIGAGDTVGVGTIGNNLLTDQSQTRSSIQVIFPEIAAANLATTLVPTAATALQLDIGDPATAGEFVRFSFSTNAKGDEAPTEIALGTTLEETIDNAVEKINNYFGTGVINFDLNQVRARRDGNTLVIETINYGDAVHLDLGGGIATAVDVNLNNTPSGVSLTNSGTLSNGTTTGVTTKGVTNSDFIGTISGFQATFTGTTDTVNASIVIGGKTYSANSVDTTATTATTVRFTSVDGGGYFDIELRANSGEAVSSQAGADTFASRLDAAFSTLTFYQNRNVSSYTGSAPIVTDGVVTGGLLGSSVKAQLTDFSDVKINDIQVIAPSGSSPNGSITFTVNGESFSSASNIGGQLGAYQTYKFVSATDANRFIEFTTGSSTIDFSSAAKAASFEAALQSAFGVGTGQESLKFQVGVTTTDTLEVSIDDVSTDALFGGEVLDVLTQVSAARASDVIDDAINAVTAVRADVGALQSRFGFSEANVQVSIQNQDAARGVLLDTDVAAESTAFATAQVQLQAGIAVLAQANQIPQNLLKLIG